MKKVIVLNKKEGETPLLSLESFRIRHKEYKDVKITYAGRLDPMASGVLVILAGEECKNKEKYLKLDKEYEFEVLFGLSTDTYDILGKIVKCTRQDLVQKELEKSIKNNLKYFKGKFVQSYPLYSSKTVAGKQLFEYARGGEEVEVPEHQVEVKSLKFLKIKKITSKKLLEGIERRVSKVSGDFRQKEIIKIWQKNLKNKDNNFYTASFKIKCGSGTYVRSISNDLGEKIGIPTLALTIVRTKVGKWRK
ncbi:MAG: tRNA pseudouridine55 synthase [Patescibacteria group bacterium]|nr:tRNA pseudouridine55 synthase [Patescibacteria group bacterium]